MGLDLQSLGDAGTMCRSDAWEEHEEGRRDGQEESQMAAHILQVWSHRVLEPVLLKGSCVPWEWAWSTSLSCLALGGSSRGIWSQQAHMLWQVRGSSSAAVSHTGPSLSHYPL